MSSHPLFPSMQAEDLSRDLLELFAAWLASAPGRGRRSSGKLAQESAGVYRDMWGAFVTYCVPTDETGMRWVRLDPLEALSADELQGFLSLSGPAAAVRGRVRGDALALRYAWRMLHLIDRVLSFGLAQASRPGPSAAAVMLMQEPYRHANASSQDPRTDILSDGEQRRLMAVIAAPVPTLASGQTDWKRSRDLACAAVMLGAGLAPGDVQALTMDGVAFEDGPSPGAPWRLTVPGDGLSPAHQTPVAAWAGEVLARWLTVRLERQISGPQVFPATLSGKPLSRPTVHAAVVGVLESAGIAGGAPFRLRHTFAVRQLGKGFSEEEVGAWMGLVEAQPMARYRQFVVTAPDLA